MFLCCSGVYDMFCFDYGPVSVWDNAVEEQSIFRMDSETLTVLKQLLKT